ncbi:MAG: peptidylprolyl isomerase, partial [Gammaproteobacteria bacterium]
MRHLQAFAIILAGLALAVGCTKAETPDGEAAKPVAVVDGTPISNDVWLLYVKTRHQGKTLDQLTPEERNEALEELIRMYVGAAEARKQKLDAGEPGARLELVSHSALAEMLFRKLSEGKEPTEEELKAEYDARIAEMPKSEYHARHILVDDEAKAKDLISKLDDGASFEALAKEHSSDGSAAEGGDLGWFMPGQMVKPFSDAVQQLEVGKYTATPVKSDFGWHVIRLIE